jgi:UDP-3-O-[3-hydroxymyristoyl] glucosamine N-acyltransferase LpxD
MTTFADVIRVLGGTSEDPTPIGGVSSSADPRAETLSFMTRWTSGSQDVVDDNPTTLFLIPADAEPSGSPSNVFRVERPRLAYALALRDALHREGNPTIASTAVVDDSAEIGEGVDIGHFCVIEPGVVIGDGTRIDHHVVLKTGVQLGRGVRIASHTSVGGHGFGFEMDDDGVPVRIGHRGGVVIGDEVEIGHQCSIAQGTIEPTTIGDHVKIDDCVFIAHNVQIGRSSYVIAGAEISGSVTIGERVWISPEVTVINKVTIGDDALVGIGAVVVKDVDPNTIVAGVPAKPRGPRHPELGQRPLTLP